MPYSNICYLSPSNRKVVAVRNRLRVLSRTTVMLEMLPIMHGVEVHDNLAQIDGDSDSNT
jgi:hypothetical protein